MHYKDAILDDLAERANVAQFVSYDPGLSQRFSRLFGFARNHQFSDVSEAAQYLLARSVDKSANVRSFNPNQPKSSEFVYGLRTVGDIVENVRRLAAFGLHTILNETIDINDGGVSGVALGDLLEFAPEDTPRCVEKPGTASFPKTMGLRFLEVVYGFKPELTFAPTTRVEFSIHPVRRGVRGEHTIIWELEEVTETPIAADIHWPNRFSRFIGDKAFGLLVASLLGLRVPRTLVIARAVAPFEFGRDTGSDVTWLRTSPRVQVPGKFTTRRGWSDPFALVEAEDPNAEFLASVLSQREVAAQFSGAVLADSKGILTIEGTVGFGDEFMVGRARSIELPRPILDAVRRTYRVAARKLGAVRMEWVHDGERVWIVQFHRGASVSSGAVIYPGDAKSVIRFDVLRGLEALRELIEELQPDSDGVILVGDVGVTSHFGDVLRKARIPSRIERASDGAKTLPVTLTH